MTQEQKQFIIKALESGIPAIAREHLDALEEVTRIEEAKQEDLNGAECFEILNQTIYETIIKVINASYPFMAAEFYMPFMRAVKTCNSKFSENAKARQEREESEKKKQESGGSSENVPEEDPARADSKKVSA